MARWQRRFGCIRAIRFGSSRGSGSEAVFLGMQEDFHLSIAMLQAWLAIAPESPQAFNVASPSHQQTMANAAASIPPDLVELDLKLFNLASTLYERQVQEYCTRYGDDLAAAAQERYRSTLTEPPACSL